VLGKKGFQTTRLFKLSKEASHRGNGRLKEVSFNIRNGLSKKEGDLKYRKM